MYLITLQGKESIYEQIKDQITKFVKLGVLKPDDKLPSVRTLAMELGINPNTVSRAYQELQHQEVIITLRGKGTFICEPPIRQKNTEEMQSIYKDMKNLCIKLHYIGITREELFHQLNLILDDLQKGYRHD